MANLKDPFRCIEKVALDPSASGNFALVTDVIRGSAVIRTCGSGNMLIETLMACDPYIAKESKMNGLVEKWTTAVGEISIVGVKNRFDAAATSSGGWRDVQIKFYFRGKVHGKKHICEIQIKHLELARIRDALVGEEYADRRNALELFQAL